MNSPWFFLSYATLDEGVLDKAVEEFCADLIKELRQKLGLHKSEVSDEEIGFCAPTMPRGSNWPKELAENLASSRVLVCLYSERYFKSDACGKEFKIFTGRLEDFVRIHPKLLPPPVVVPVLWVVPKTFPNSLPRAAQAIHYKGFDSALNAGGVYYLKTLPRYAGEYKDYLNSLADTVREAGEIKPPLTTCEKMPDFEQAWNAWIDPPSAPTGLDAEFQEPNQVRLSWKSNSVTKTGFHVERRRAGSDDFLFLEELDAATTTYIDAGVATGTQYRYRICAVNRGGRSPYTETADVKTQIQKTPAPSEFSAKAISTSHIKLVWNDNSGGAARSKIERRCETDRDFREIAKLTPGVTKYRDSGLARATTYVYQICGGDDENGESNYVASRPTTTLKFWPIPIPIWTVPIVVGLIVVVIASLFWYATRKPIIRTASWSDPFTDTGSSGNPSWQLGDNWDTPGWQPRWESNNPNGVLVVKGNDPGIVKTWYFDDFEFVFEIQFEKGNRAGWFVRAQPNWFWSYTGVCFVLEKVPNGFQLAAFWGTPQSLHNTKPELTPIPITEFNANDKIRVTSRIEGDTVLTVFDLKSKTNPSRPDLARCFVAPVKLVNRGLEAGYIGLFADDSTQFSIDSIDIFPIKPGNESILEDCSFKVSTIYVK